VLEIDAIRGGARLMWRSHPGIGDERRIAISGDTAN
jgi:hypothetical protein